MINFYNAFKHQFGKEPESILEIGSRDGESIEELRKLANLDPKNVYVVEPHPESYKNIINRFSDFNVFPFAISDEIRAINFNAIPHFCGKDMVGTSSLLKKNKETYMSIPGVTEEVFNRSNAENWIKVLSITGEILLQLTNKLEIDMVKIDVEGMTWEVLDSFGPDITKLKLLHLEVEKVEIWKDQCLYEDVQKLLHYYGFQELYYIPLYFGGNQGDSVWIKR